MIPTLLHYTVRGRADQERGTPWLHAPQSPEDVQLCGESEAQRAYWQGYGSRPEAPEPATAEAAA